MMKNFSWRRQLHGNRSGKLNAAGVGYGLAVAGAVLAFISFVGYVFLPATTVPLDDWYWTALGGLVLLIAAIPVHAAGD